MMPVRNLDASGRSWTAVLALVALLMAAAIGAPAARGQSAGATGAFARIGFGARGIGAGNALVADRAASAYYNPAFAPLTTRQNLSASAAILSFDRQLQFFQFAVPLQPRAGFAFGLTHAGVSDIDGRDDSGYHTETLSTDEYQIFAAFGLRFGERVSAGLAAKFYRSDFGLDGVDPVEAVGFDLGLSVRATERLALGLAVSDLLAAYNWDTSSQYDDQEGRLTEDRLPLRLRLGAAYRLFDEKVKLLGEVEARTAWREERTIVTDSLDDGTTRPSTEEEVVSHTGGQARLGATYRPVDILTLRAGVDRLFTETRARPTAGFTVRQDIGRLPVSVSYGAAVERDPGTTMHVFALRLFL